MPLESQPLSFGNDTPHGKPRRLRVLTWHVHGNYLYYLSHAPHDFYLVTKPGAPSGYAGRTGSLPWGDNVHEVDAAAVRSGRFDCILYQSRTHFENDRELLLSDQQKRLPAIYLEHDPPQQHPTDTPHWVQDPNMLLVHVTPFNALMWDSGCTPVLVIEHGAVVPADAQYTGELERGIVVVNNLRRRARRLGADVFAAARERVPLDLVGMDAQAVGGIGEIGNLELPRFIGRYRFFFNPIRWTSLGLAVIEAMMVGMPIVGLATTELSSVIDRGVNGYVDTDLERLVETMHLLIREPALAARWGRAAQATAHERFGIGRFVTDWNRAFALVTS
jgi:glycosyltransferase involved in cell wall biosynthesis